MPGANTQKKKRHHRYRSPASGGVEEEVGAPEELEAVSELLAEATCALSELAAAVPCSPDLASVLRPHTLVAWGLRH